MINDDNRKRSVRLDLSDDELRLFKAACYLNARTMQSVIRDAALDFTSRSKQDA